MQRAENEFGDASKSAVTIPTMKRLGRWLFKFVAVVAAVLCLASMLFWVRSYWRRDRAAWFGRTVEVGTSSNSGQVTFQRMRWPRGEKDRIYFLKGFHFGSDEAQAPGPRNPWLFQWRFGEMISGRSFITTDDEVHVPYWFVCLLLASPPALMFLQYHRQRRRTLKGLCLTCGYDLRATPERCPECGTIPKG